MSIVDFPVDDRGKASPGQLSCFLIKMPRRPTGMLETRYATVANPDARRANLLARGASVPARLA